MILETWKSPGQRFAITLSSASLSSIGLSKEPRKVDEDGAEDDDAMAGGGNGRVEGGAGDSDGDVSENMADGVDNCDVEAFEGVCH